MSSPASGMPRIEPLPQHSAAEAYSNGRRPLNIFLTLAKHERLLDRFVQFGGFFLLGEGLVPARERELVILRVGWRCGSQYEFGHHTVLGRRAGLSDAEISRLASSDLSGWSETDRSLVRLADELCAQDRVSGETWAGLYASWSEQQLMELLILAGFYRLVSGFLNSVGVQLEPGLPGWPAST